MSTPIYVVITTLILGVCSSFCNAAKGVAATTPKSTATVFEDLNRHYYQFSAEFYAAYLRQQKPPGYKTVEQLDSAVSTLTKNNQPIEATALVVQNIALIKKNIDNPKTLDFVELLLEQNEWKSAENLFSAVKEDGSKGLISNVNYLTAQYFFVRSQWNAVLSNLEGISGDLPRERQYHALLMQGIALQHLKKHRPALGLYEKIPPASKYYTPARINIAIADIRQDWWTDAHVEINTLLASPSMRNHYDTSDRLYTILGYSFLQQQYYRNSRDAFRNVGVDSPYANQALLGIALTAANQDDYIGALNAVRILKGKKSLDLSSDEAYLLMPYFYEKLQQPATASAGYNEAIQYYESRINGINQLLQTDATAFIKGITFNGEQSLSLQNNAIDTANRCPVAFVTEYLSLTQYKQLVAKLNQQKLSQSIATLETQYTAQLQEIVTAALRERISFLTDYMNQSRYGIARLLDKTETPDETSNVPAKK
ncbi:MAG: hypothetical protein HY080_02635 [Gammaproteobacteria bacterium]|nr:hypothetical protein [Gammaproteobacteria bacterium]